MEEQKKANKKIILIVILFIVSLYLLIVGIYNGWRARNNNQICVHTWVDASCETPKTCSLCLTTEGEALGHTFTNATCESAQKCTTCYKTIGDPLGHTTDSGICDNCGKNFSSWIRGNYVDKFQNPTGQKYILNTSKGTSDGKTVYVDVFVDYKMAVSFEFSDHFEVSRYYPYSVCYKTEISVLDEDNEEHSLYITTTPGQDSLFFFRSVESDKNSEAKFIELLKANDTLKVVISGWDYRYYFTMNTKGFQEACDYLNE